MTNLKIKTLGLFLVDSLIFFLSLFLALYFRYKVFAIDDINKVNEQFINHLPHFIIIFIIFFLVFHINNLYNLRLLNSFKKLVRLSLSSLSVSIALATIYFYLNVSASIAPRTNLFIFLLIYTILLLIWRYLFFLLIEKTINKSQLIIIGRNNLSDKLINKIRTNPNLGYEVSLILDGKDDLDKLESIVKSSNSFNIVFSGNLNDNNGIRNILFKYLTQKINFFSFPEFYEMISEKIPVEAINQDWFLNNLKEASKNYYNFFKNIFDKFLAFIFLIITLPFWPIIALIIKLESKGPVFFKQKRIGLNGQIFYLKKFRSMKEENNDRSMTEKNDKRITKFGAWLRKTRLDELPQLLNILKSEMSFIGPRPERPEIVAELENSIPFYRTRLLIKPGLTGWDQVSGKYHSPSTSDSLEKLESDLYYLKNRSIYLDIIIILKTISTVINRKGV